MQLRIECNMTDEDVIARLVEWSGVGHKAGPYGKAPRKPCWRFIVNRKADAEALMREVYPLLSLRRQGQIRAAFAALALPPP